METLKPITGTGKTARRSMLAACTAAAVFLGGCLASAPKAPVNWTIALDRADAHATQTASIPPLRLASVSVRAPYDGTRLCVLRPDGSLAFDSFNAFAAAPSQLMRGALLDALEAKGVKAYTHNSSVHCSYSIEAQATLVALDCRRQGEANARVDIALTLLDGRRAVSSAKASGVAPKTGGDFSAIFSRAFASAAYAAIENLFAPEDET